MFLFDQLFILVLIPKFSRLSGDVLAGLTVACMLIPQSVSYATSLARLSPLAGLVRFGEALIPNVRWH